MKCRTRLGLIFAALTFGLSAQVVADVSASTLYEQMRDAVRHLDYEGRFVHQVGDRLDSMYVVHRVREGREFERLVALNGAPKQVIRGEHAVACLDPHNRKINVLGAGTRLAGVEISDTEQLGSLYRFSTGREVRVAGRNALELLVQPLDAFRFGYRIALDQDTRLPLQSAMLDDNGRVRSQTLFVDLKTGDQVTPIEHDLTALQLTDDPLPASAAPPRRHSYRLNAGLLPSGFRLIKSLEPEPLVSHLLLSDGLASVSVYLEQPGDQDLDGYSTLGSTEVYGTRRNGMQVTVVGEVPRRTLASIAGALELR